MPEHMSAISEGRCESGKNAREFSLGGRQAQSTLWDQEKEGE